MAVAHEAALDIGWHQGAKAMSYSTVDWACDQIRAYEAAHNQKPDSLLLTEVQALSLLEGTSRLLGDFRPLAEQLQGVRKGEVRLMGVPLKLFEVPHGQAQ
ncbi:MAG: hypothetical protein ACREPD_05560 [Stenotrophomonas sp.]|uniref:hypothetical protein n=1 Tax=Stenotrophomonas sp. TaxID=69392 RepID=UPI003D6CD102